MKIQVPGLGYLPPYAVMVKEVPKNLKIMQVVANILSCPFELDSKILLLKHHTL